MSPPSTVGTPTSSVSALGAVASHPKVPLPTGFDGTRTKLRLFIAQAELYIGFNVGHFSGEDRKVLWAISLLSGAAFNWVEPHLNDYLENAVDPKAQEPMTRKIFKTFANFKEEITKVFGDIDPGRTAERIIQNLKQTGSAVAYAADFQQYSGRTDWNDEALAAQFYKGLKEHVKDEIARRDRPEGLDAMIETAVKIDNRTFERNLEKRGHYHEGHGKKRKFQGRWNSPMELDAVNRRNKGPKKPHHPKKLSQDEVRRRKEKGLCYECGLPGHMASSHRQNKPFKGNRQTNAVNIRQVYMLNRKKPERPLPKNSLEREEIHNQVALKLGSGRAKEIRDRLRTLQPEQLEKEKIHTQITDSQVTYDGIGKYGNAPDSSSDEEYLVVKENPLKARKEHTKEPLGKYHPSRVGLGEPAPKDDEPLGEWTETNNDMKTFIETAGSDTSHALSRISSLTPSEEQELQERMAEACLQHHTEEISSDYLKDVERERIKNWNNLADLAKIPRTLVSHAQHPRHPQLSWTACWHDQCPYHRSGKDRTGFWPKKGNDIHWKNENFTELCAVGTEGHFMIPVKFANLEFKVMVDSGSQANLIDFRFARSNQIPLNHKRHPYEVTVMDGSPGGRDGWVRKETAPMEMIMPDGHTEMIILDVMTLGSHQVVLGSPWIRKHNPEINWENDTLRFSRCDCKKITT